MSETKLEAVFIELEVDESIANDADLAAKLEEVCPVDIYRATAAGVEIVQAQLDECVLCELCINAAPPGSVKVLKLYDGTALIRE